MADTLPPDKYRGSGKKRSGKSGNVADFRYKRSSQQGKKAKAKAELSTTIANILGDAIIPGLFNLVGCVGSFIVFQYFCFTNFCRVKRREKSEVADFVIDYGRRELLKVSKVFRKNEV